MSSKSSKKRILLITNGVSLWKPYEEELKRLGFEVDFCSSFCDIKTKCAENTYFCAIIDAADPCSFVSAPGVLKDFTAKYGQWSMGTPAAGIHLAKAQVPFLSFALMDVDIDRVPEDLKGLVWMGLVACKPELTSRIFKLLKTIPDGSTEETFKRVLKGASSETPMRQVANS